MRAAIYLRISQDRTGEALGVERQREAAAELVARHGWTSVEFVDNAVSASNGRRRPAYEAMLAAVERGEVRAIVAWSLDRLLRTLPDLERLAILCDRHGIPVELVRGATIDLSSPDGRLVARLLGSVARHEVEKKVDRQRVATEQRAKRGEPSGGRRAFGYTTNGRELNPAEAPAVKAAFAALLAGRTLTGIAEDLHGAGHTTTVGNPWHHTSVRRMLQNARYAGILVRDGREYPAVWPALVTEDVYRAACALLAAPQRRANKVGNARRWVGTRLYRCGREGCGTLLVSAYRDDKRRIYRCPSCHLSRRAEPVDAWVETVVEMRLSAPDVADLLAVEQGTDSDHLAALRTEAAALRVRQAETLDLFKEGVITKAELTTTRAELAEKLDAVERQLEDAGRADAAAPVLLAADPVAAWRALDEVGQRQAVIRRVLKSVTLLPTPTGVRKFREESVLFGRRDDRPQ